METKLNTNQLGNNEIVFTESTLIGGKNILIQKKINPNVLDSDTIGCWYLNGNENNEIADGPVLDSSYITEYTDALTDPWYTGYQCANIRNSSGGPRQLMTTDVTSIGTVGDFTWEAHLKCNSTGGLGAYIGEMDGTDYLNLSLSTSTGGTISFKHKNTSGWDYSETGKGTSGWHHYAIVRKNSILSLYFDGTRIYQESSTDNTNIKNFIVFSQIGSSDGGNRVAEVVLSKVAKWDGDSFTVPTEPYTISSTADTYEINATGGTDLTTITNYKAGIQQQLINTANGVMWGSKERWYSNFKNGNKLEIYFNCPSTNPTTADIIWQVTTQQHTATEGKGSQNMLTMDTTSNPKSILYGDAADGALLGYFDSSTVTYFTNSIGATDSTRWLRIHRENGDNVLYALNGDNYSIDALPELTSWELQGTLSGASIISGFGFSTNSDWGFKGTLKNLVIIFDNEKLFDLRYGNNVYDNASGGWNSHIIVEEKWV